MRVSRTMVAHFTLKGNVNRTVIIGELFRRGPEPVPGAGGGSCCSNVKMSP